ncbi:MAG TPA: hypothetical protein VNO19_04960 [Gemmatimonadales bacterium]|nr:hypothetical protein [Gemmatimonadales bacterium]
MNRHVSSRLEMGARALEFSRAHAVESSGYATALKQLEEQIARANQLAKEQERGTTEVRAATARKRELKRSIRRSQLVHLGRVAERAAKEVPGLAQKFDLPRIPARNLAFRTVARTMVEEAQQQQELLVKHGLVAEVLDSLSQSLDQFDQAVERAAEGRRVHIGAAANLQAVSDEVVQIVRLIDGYNRHRFATEPDLLAAWTAACNVIGPARTGGQPDGRTDKPSDPPPQGQIKPAA